MLDAIEVDDQRVEIKGCTVKCNEVSAPNSMCLYFKMKAACDAHIMFESLRTVEGYKLLDPDSDPEDFNKPIWGPFPIKTGGNKKSEAQGEYAYVEPSMFLSPREFVVANMFDYTTLRFYSKSVLLPEECPGCTDFSGSAIRNTKTGRIRLPFFSCYMAEPIPKADPMDKPTCYFSLVFWADMQGWLGGASESINKKYMGKDVWMYDVRTLGSISFTGCSRHVT